MKRPHGMILPYTVRLFLTCEAIFIFICHLYYYIYIPYLQSLSLLLFRPVHFLITMLVYYKLYLQLL